MHEYTACHAIAVYSCECLSASFGIPDDSPYQEDIKQDHESRSHEAPFLSDCTENEVGTLLWNEAVCGLGAVEIAFSEESARTDRNHGLIHVVTDSGRVFFHTQKHFDTLSLMVLKHFVEDEVGREHQNDACYHRQ